MSKKSKEPSKLLDLFNEEEILQNIEEAHLVKFGNLYVSNKDKEIPDVEHCYSVHYWVGTPEKGESPFNIEKLVSCLKNSPQVEKVIFSNKKAKNPMARIRFRPFYTLALQTSSQV